MFTCKILCRWWIGQKLMDDLIYHVFWQVLCTFSFCDKVAGQVQFSDTFLRTCCNPLSFCSREKKMKIHYCFYCLYGHVFFISVRYSCSTSFLCSLANIFWKDGASSQCKLTTHKHQQETKNFIFAFVSDKVCEVFWWICGVVLLDLWVFLSDQNNSCFKIVSYCSE